MELLAGLTAIGFTEYEAKVYLALLRESPATGYQLSKRAGVPRSMVYEALGRLQTRGAVLVTDRHRATLYRPLPPDVLLNRYEQEQHRLTSDLREGLRSLHETTEEDRIWSISGRDPVLSYAAQMLQRARTEALLVMNDPDLEVLRSEVEAACERGVSVGALLTGEGELGCGRAVRHPPQESKLQQLTDDLVIVIDSHEALISNTVQETTATITLNRNLVLIARQFVWMELFAQRIYTRLSPELLAQLDPEDRRMLESFSPQPGA
ncbi:MAG TPA: helix-turn-helix domain-containing protein [Anaerolineae bacterium]